MGVILAIVGILPTQQLDARTGVENAQLRIVVSHLAHDSRLIAYVANREIGLRPLKLYHVGSLGLIVLRVALLLEQAQHIDLVACYLLQQVPLRGNAHHHLWLLALLQATARSHHCHNGHNSHRSQYRNHIVDSSFHC